MGCADRSRTNEPQDRPSVCLPIGMVTGIFATRCSGRHAVGDSLAGVADHRGAHRLRQGVLRLPPVDATGARTVRPVAWALNEVKVTSPMRTRGPCPAYSSVCSESPQATV